MLTPSFSVAQLQSDLKIIRFTDTSQGSDVLITERRIYIQNDALAYLVPTGNPSAVYILWDINEITKNVSVLTSDLALSIRVTWNAADGSVLYSATNTFDFDARNLQFYYQLAQTQTGYPPVVQNTNYFVNAGNIYTAIKASEYAIEFEGNTGAAQSQLNIATNLSQQQNKYF